MNKYQKQRSKEIKAIMRKANSVGGDSWKKFEVMTYREAKKIWKLYRAFEFYNNVKWREFRHVVFGEQETR